MAVPVASYHNGGEAIKRPPLTTAVRPSKVCIHVTQNMTPLLWALHMWNGCFIARYWLINTQWHAYIYIYIYIYIYMFVVVNFDALAQASDIQIERRQVVFLSWKQDLNPGPQTPIRQQTECSLTNRLSYIHTYIHNTNTYIYIYIHKRMRSLNSLIFNIDRYVKTCLTYWGVCSMTEPTPLGCSFHALLTWSYERSALSPLGVFVFRQEKYVQCWPSSCLPVSVKYTFHV